MNNSENPESIVAFIPVKKNSSRLPRKNLLPFADSTLLEHKIKQLQCVDKISEIIVSSDSEEMLEVAVNNGVLIDERPECFADETKPFSEFLEYMISKTDSNHLMWACCTSPLMTPERYREAIELYFQKIKIGYDSLISVFEFKHFMLDKNGPMNFERGPNHVNSQELPSYDIFTNGVILSPIESVKKWRYHYGPKVYRMNVSQIESIDIDTEFDYQVALAAQAMTKR
jgi:N-acylneuraminate cytidylyltransferase